MSKPTEGISRRDECQSSRNRLLEIFAGASTHPSQERFQFGESLFNRREIRRISRQKQETTAFGFDGLFHPVSQVNAQVIQDDNLPSLQAWSKDLLDVDFKGARIGRAIQNEGFSHARKRQGSDQRHVGSIVARNLSYGPLPSGSISVQRRHGNMRAGLIYKHQLLTDEVLSLLAPGGPRCFILFACSQRLFFRVQPRAILAREMLAGLTLMPKLSSKSRQCSSRVTSGYRSSCSLRPACNAAPFLAGRPGIAFGKTWPVSRRALRYRLMVGTETANVFAISAWLVPASTARSTRCRRSCE
jgi:hypothetical protein